MECPKCSAKMEEVNFQNVEIDRCEGCSGLWFDTGEAESLSRTWVTEWLDIGDPEIGEKFDHADKVLCPRCNVAMENHFDLEKSQICFEVCPTHGKFFDAGEFTIWLDNRYLKNS